MERMLLMFVKYLFAAVKATFVIVSLFIFRQHYFVPKILSPAFQVQGRCKHPHLTDGRCYHSKSVHLDELLQDVLLLQEQHNGHKLNILSTMLFDKVDSSDSRTNQ